MGFLTGRGLTLKTVFLLASGGSVGTPSALRLAAPSMLVTPGCLRRRGRSPAPLELMGKETPGCGRGPNVSAVGYAALAPTVRAEGDSSVCHGDDAQDRAKALSSGGDSSQTCVLSFNRGTTLEGKSAPCYIAHPGKTVS